MALTQTQIIQSLAEALSWFEKELTWGVKEAELRHLTGRIGELYAAMITRGQMALETNQRGYDVISGDNERISVKTITSSNHVRFNLQTLGQVDRVMILQIIVDGDEGVSIGSLFDGSTDEVLPLCRETNGDLVYTITSRRAAPKPLDNIDIIKRAAFQGFEILQYESGTIIILKDGATISPAKPVLRDMARQIGVDLLLESGTPKNTRQLGAGVIRQLGLSH